MNLISYLEILCGGPGSGVYEHQKGIKGWVSPEGKMKLFDYDKVHQMNIPREVPKGKHPFNFGYTRFGSIQGPDPELGQQEDFEGRTHYLQFDSRHGGLDSALKTMQFLKPKLGDKITLVDRGKQDEQGDEQAYFPRTPGDAYRILTPERIAASWWWKRWVA